MRIAICDDDGSFCTQTVRMVREVLMRRGIEAEVEPFADAATLLRARKNGRAFDAYLLDILMPNMDGMELARSLRAEQPKAPIAFLTTSKDYAREAFSIDASNYIEKPLAEARLETVLDRLLALLPKPEDEMLVVRTTEGEIRSVPLSEIIWAETDGHYQNLRLWDGQKVRCRMSGVELWERLSSVGLFVQANKGVLLGLRHVRTLTADKAVLSGGESVPVSRRALPEVRNALFRYSCR